MSRALESIDDFKKVCGHIESKQDENPHCLHCGETRIHKHCIPSGHIRYKCTTLRKTFNSLTGTPLARMKKKHLWFKYLSEMLKSTVLGDIGAHLEIDKKTAPLWRHHITVWLHKNTPPVLEGIIEKDETYLRS